MFLAIPLYQFLKRFCINAYGYVIICILTTGYSLGCDNGWIESPLDDVDSCYKFIIVKKASRSQAQGLCRDMGGHLAVLETDAEIVLMKGYRVHNPSLRKGMYWIGGYEKNGAWYWKGDVADSPILVTDWANGQPDDFSGEQDCLVLFGESVPTPAHWFRFDDNYYAAQYAFVY